MVELNIRRAAKPSGPPKRHDRPMIAVLIVHHSVFVIHIAQGMTPYDPKHWLIVERADGNRGCEQSERCKSLLKRVPFRARDEFSDGSVSIVSK